MLFAYVGLNVLKTFIPPSISQAQAIGMDGKVLVFTGLISLVTGLIFGLAPATQASNFGLSETLKEGGRDSSAGSRGNRIRSVLVVSEVAVSFLLLIGAGLLINSFLHLRKLDPGYRADHLLTMKVSLPETKYPDKERRAPFFRELIRRVQTLPGVESVAVASNLPLTYNGDSMPIGAEGRPDPPPDQSPDVILRVVSPGYFRTMGIPLVSGRDFTENDSPEAAKGRRRQREDRALLLARAESDRQAAQAGIDHFGESMARGHRHREGRAAKRLRRRTEDADVHGARTGWFVRRQRGRGAHAG